MFISVLPIGISIWMRACWQHGIDPLLSARCQLVRTLCDKERRLPWTLSLFIQTQDAVCLCLCLLVSVDHDSQVVRRITERGYRNMAGSKNPEASVTGALSRDVLFTRLGPAIYALAVSTCLSRLPEQQHLMYLQQGLVVKPV